MKTLTIWLPNYLTPSLNKLVAKGWRAKHGEKQKAARALLLAFAGSLNPGNGSGTGTISWEGQNPSPISFDLSALLKLTMRTRSTSKSSRRLRKIPKKWERLSR